MVLRGEETVQQIRARYETANLLIADEIRLTFTLKAAEGFYAEHRGRPWFEGLILAMSSGPSVAWRITGEDAVAKVRELNGETDPRQAKPGTIRELFRSAGGPFNSVRGSDSSRAAVQEWVLVKLAAVKHTTKGFNVSYQRAFCVGNSVGLWIPAERYEVKDDYYYFFGGSPEEVVAQVSQEQVLNVYRAEY